MIKRTYICLIILLVNVNYLLLFLYICIQNQVYKLWQRENLLLSTNALMTHKSGGLFRAQS